jgi:GR25 family glycosyltransferase involved in LPS biosynthesis
MSLNGVNIIYWINLDRSKERRNHMETILKDPVFEGIKTERIKAIDGEKDRQLISKNIDIHLTDYKSINLKMSVREYACLLSHLETIRKFSESNYKYAIIFEDDITLEYKKYWEKDLSDLIKEAPKDWQIIRLQRAPYESNDISFKQSFKKWDFIKRVTTMFPKKRVTADWGAYAYLIKNSAAKQLIKRIYKHNKYKLNDKYPLVADAYIYKMLRTYTYKYPYFTYRAGNKNSTTIHDKIGNECRKKLMDRLYKKYNKTRKNKKHNKTIKNKKRNKTNKSIIKA